MKRILILANFDVGLYKFRKELIQELLKKGNEVYISLPEGEFVRNLEEIGCKYIKTEVDRRRINLKIDAKLMLFYRKVIKKLKPELVITYTIKPNIYGGMMCRVLKIPYAVNITGLGTAFQDEGIVKKLVTVLYKIALKKAKVIFFENSENRQIMSDMGIVKEEKTCVLKGAGVNLEEYPVFEYPHESQTKFLFIGRVMREKGIDELFSAMQKLSADGIKCSLDVLGGYEEDYADVMKAYEEKGWLHYHGYQKDVRPFIKNCHCFVLPSWHEGMANTNLECAASGRPVITSNIHGCKEAVIEGVSGFLSERKNADDLYMVMKRFTQLSYEERIEMGMSGRRYMEEIFDKKKIVEETIDKL